MRSLIAAAILLLFSHSAMAVDGVKEINQLCVQFGCFAGDSPGFPVTLASNGSYRLTSNLSITDVNTSGITATADLVTVDLNGFTISGPVNCGGIPVTSCSAGSGTGNGVNLNNSGNISGGTVKNGLIQGMGASGVFCRNCTISNVSSRSNRQYGFYMLGGILTGSAAISNGSHGVNSIGLVESSFAQGNGGSGFFFYDGLLRGSRAVSNGDDGIQCVNRCSALDNVSTGNVGYGLRFSATSGSRSSYGRNNIYSNDEGAVFGVGLQLDNNRCDASFCP